MNIPDIDFEPYCVTYGHTPVAGMMHVHPEDLDTVARMRRDRGIPSVTCDDCDARYDVDRGWVL
jgi:hypothetical protein